MDPEVQDQEALAANWQAAIDNAVTVWSAMAALTRHGQAVD
jgi:hypothetical protein